MNKIKNFIIILLMKILKIILKILGKQGGNVLGKVAKKLNPQIIKSFRFFIWGKYLKRRISIVDNKRPKIIA